MVLISGSGRGGFSDERLGPGRVIIRLPLGWSAVSNLTGERNYLTHVPDIAGLVAAIIKSELNAMSERAYTTFLVD